MKNISAFLNNNTFTRFPNKKWGFVGNVYKYLMFENKDGSKPTEKEMKEGFEKAKNLGERFSGLKSRSWDTPLDAFKEAKKLNQSILINNEQFDDKRIHDALKQSGVKYKVS